jgi:hypothetical protein
MFEHVDRRAGLALQLVLVHFHHRPGLLLFAANLPASAEKRK